MLILIKMLILWSNNKEPNLLEVAKNLLSICVFVSTVTNTVLANDWQIINVPKWETQTVRTTAWTSEACSIRAYDLSNSARMKQDISDWKYSDPVANDINTYKWAVVTLTGWKGEFWTNYDVIVTGWKGCKVNPLDLPKK